MSDHDRSGWGWSREREAPRGVDPLWFDQLSWLAVWLLVAGCLWAGVIYAAWRVWSAYR